MTLFTKIYKGVAFTAIGLGMLVLAALGVMRLLKFPEHDYALELHPATPEEEDIALELERIVRELASGIGPRNVVRHPEGLGRAAAFIDSEWGNLSVHRQPVESSRGASDNLFVDLPGTDPSLPRLILGAHYDTAFDSPGADDNASGVAMLLVMARLIEQNPLRWPVRLIAFTNEEPPEYRTDAMGSIAYVERFGDEPTAMMFSLETVGFYTKEAKSQDYPWPMEIMYPSVGDFVAFVGDFGSRKLTKQVIEGFRRATALPAGAVTLPDFVEGAGWSDHWAFWQKQIPAVMVTDTAVFRYPHYHRSDDTPEKLNYRTMARVVTGLMALFRDPAFDANPGYEFEF